jgi:tight adherence protein B
MFWFGAGILIAGIWFATGALLLAVERRQRLRSRLLRAAVPELAGERLGQTGWRVPQEAAETGRRGEEEKAPSVAGALVRASGAYQEQLERRLRELELPFRPGQWLAGLAAGWVAAPLLAWAAGAPPWGAAAALLAAVAAPGLALAGMQAWRRKLFRQQLPDALEMACAILRAGHNLQRAFQFIGAEAPSPLAREIRRVVADAGLGTPISVALRHAAQRVRSADFHLLASAIGVQQQTGGNMAEIITHISEAIREREELAGEVRSLTAEARLTAFVCIAMTPAMGLVVAWLNPEYMEPLLQTPVGRGLLAGTAIFQLVGAVVVQRMARLET